MMGREGRQKRETRNLDYDDKDDYLFIGWTSYINLLILLWFQSNVKQSNLFVFVS